MRFPIAPLLALAYPLLTSCSGGSSDHPAGTLAEHRAHEEHRGRESMAHAPTGHGGHADHEGHRGHGREAEHSQHGTREGAADAHQAKAPHGHQSGRTAEAHRRDSSRHASGGHGDGGHRAGPESGHHHQHPPQAGRGGEGGGRVPGGDAEVDAVAARTAGQEDDADEPDARAIFEKRILPIFHSPKPSSCTECHLGGVDLKDYIHADQAKTFAALRQGGLIDVENPDGSKLLAFIARSPERPSLISAEVRRQELAAFRGWIRAAVKDPGVLAAAEAERLGAKLPVEVIRHGREDRVLASFVDNVWSEIRRCASCHSPDQNQKHVKEHGEQVSWIALGDARATMQYLLDADLIDLETPDASLILTKPTVQVEHGGGQKMLIGDRTYKQFLRFIEDYAAVVQGKYTSADQLPAPAEEVSVASEIWLRIDDVPERLDKVFLRADVHRWEGSGWSERPWATGDRAIWGKGRRWGQHLTVVAARGSARADDIRRNPALPQGRYLVKIYLDEEGKLEKDPAAELSPADLAGAVEVDSHWRKGYGSPTAVKFPSGP